MNFFKLRGHLSLILSTRGKVFRRAFFTFFPRPLKEGTNASVCLSTDIPLYSFTLQLTAVASGGDNVSSTLLRRQTNLRQFVFHTTPNKLSDWGTRQILSGKVSVWIATYYLWVLPSTPISFKEFVDKPQTLLDSVWILKKKTTSDLWVSAARWKMCQQ